LRGKVLRVQIHKRTLRNTIPALHTLSKNIKSRSRTSGRSPKQLVCAPLSRYGTYKPANKSTDRSDNKSAAHASKMDCLVRN